ncbi:MAG: hypothetical protein KAU50_02865 [Candidatus Marinimicrobia bacterium]|nr:hypothetical protein [Candidatus Neomarinimicrobiota bacterium]
MSGTQIIITPTIEPSWKVRSTRRGHAFHPMCSYMAMFPPRLPNYFIQRFSNRGDLVLDPFSGRGTTATEACVNGRVGVANDLNPLAYMLSRAKVNPPTKDAAIARLHDLERGFKGAHLSPNEPEEIEFVFHPRTLKQLVYLKAELTDSREDTFIKATITGILHGKYRKNGTDSMYLSVDMPNTFSMSPGYIQRYVRNKGIKLLDLDVFEKVAQRLERLYRDGLPETEGEAYNRNVRTLHEVIEPQSISLVVTSPPYLKVIKYGLYNWIRLWFLGIPVNEVDAALDDAHALPEYLEFMSETVTLLEQSLKPGGVCALVIGDVAQNGKPPLNLAREVWEAVAPTASLRLIKIVEDRIADHAKVTKIWKQTRGRATATDRVLVLCKGDQPAVNNPRAV